jgi:hypothetical protein
MWDLWWTEWQRFSSFSKLSGYSAVRYNHILCASRNACGYVLTTRDAIAQTLYSGSEYFNYPFNAGIKSVSAKLPAEIFYCGF